MSFPSGSGSKNGGGKGDPRNYISHAHVTRGRRDETSSQQTGASSRGPASAPNANARDASIGEIWRLPAVGRRPITLTERGAGHTNHGSAPASHATSRYLHFASGASCVWSSKRGEKPRHFQHHNLPLLHSATLQAIDQERGVHSPEITRPYDSDLSGRTAVKPPTLTSFLTRSAPSTPRLGDNRTRKVSRTRPSWMI